jgi:hypothetical protein
MKRNVILPYGILILLSLHCGTLLALERPKAAQLSSTAPSREAGKQAGSKSTLYTSNPWEVKRWGARSIFNPGARQFVETMQWIIRNR